MERKKNLRDNERRVDRTLCLIQCQEKRRHQGWWLETWFTRVPSGYLAFTSTSYLRTHTHTHTHTHTQKNSTTDRNLEVFLLGVCVCGVLGVRCDAEVKARYPDGSLYRTALCTHVPMYSTVTISFDFSVHSALSEHPTLKSCSCHCLWAPAGQKSFYLLLPRCGNTFTLNSGWTCLRGTFTRKLSKKSSIVYLYIAL